VELPSLCFILLFFRGSVVVTVEYIMGMTNLKGLCIIVQKPKACSTNNWHISVHDSISFYTVLILYNVFNILLYI